jgi:signal transduction histidine kinase
MYELFEDNKIQFVSAIQVPDKEIVVEEKLRNNVFLILKEAAHNILKHAQAKRVVFEVKFLNNFCFISLNDNGKGIDVAGNISSGNGLINIRARALESGIDLTINTNEQKGTTIGLRFKI